MPNKCMETESQKILFQGIVQDQKRSEGSMYENSIKVEMHSKRRTTEF